MAGETATALAMGLTFGISAGLAPGPLMTLVIAQSLRFGARAGILVAIAPVLTDVPIVLASLLLLNTLPTTVLGTIGLVGAGYVVFLAIETMRLPPPSDRTAPTATGSVRKGVLVNLLSPHPYLFWTTVGGPFVVSSSPAAPWAPWVFVAAFYCLLVGAKVGAAAVTARFRRALSGPAFPWVMRLLGLAMIGFAARLAYDGLTTIGIV